MNFITIIGTVESLFTALSLLPQLIKLIKEKKQKIYRTKYLLFYLPALPYGFIMEY